MKNFLLHLLPLAMLASGCAQEELQSDLLDSQGGRVFTASFEQNKTRTYLEEGSLLRWNAGDQIALFDGNTLNRKYKFDGETGDNSGTFSIVSNPFGTGNDLDCHYAVYPYASDVKITESGVITATLPAEQNYAENSFGLGANTMVAVTKDLDDTFMKFQNVGGYLKLQLYGDDIIVKSISLTGGGNEKIAGKASITPVFGHEPAVTMSDDAPSSITLNCGEGVKIGTTAESATAFWIVVPPTTFENGFVITITDINGETFTKSTSNGITIERNVIKPMKAFEVAIDSETENGEVTIPNNQIWYTSSDGSVVNPNFQAVFDADIISNIYENGQGIITFDDEVTTIGMLSFGGCYNLKSVTIPNSITTIENAVFVGCQNLAEFKGKYASDGGRCLIKDCAIIAYANASGIKYTIPDNVTTVSNGAFGGCPSLTEIMIPDKVTTIEISAFDYCDNLISIYCKATAPPTIPYTGHAFYKATIYVPMESVYEYRKAYGWKSFADNIVAFDYESNEVVIEDNIIYYTSDNGKVVDPYNADSFGAKIISNTYNNGQGVIEFDKDVISIGFDAFHDCASLTSITIPDSVMEVEPGAFYNCYSLKEFKGHHASDDGHCLVLDGVLVAYAEASGTEYMIPDNVTEIGGMVFCDFNKLTHISIPNGVTAIGYSAFQSCSRLTSIIIPDSVTKIGSQAFLYCFELNDVTIGNSVKTIDSMAFSYCPILNLSIPDSVEEIRRSAFYCCSELANLTMGNGVTEICDEAFAHCYSLTNVTIPQSVTTIYNDAFYNCYNLVNIFCTPIVPPTASYWHGEYEWEAFDFNASGRKIYVPRSSVEAYKLAEGWSNYASDIVGYDF